MIEETFVVKENGDRFTVEQNTTMDHSPKVIVQIYEDLQKKKETLEAQILELPRHKELLEKDIKIFEMRMEKIKPHLNRAYVLIRKEEESLKKMRKQSNGVTKDEKPVTG